MNSATALMTPHNIANPNSTGESCKLLFKPESTEREHMLQVGC
jgi:hypothetical protein